MLKKINIGAGPDWVRNGWDIADHKHGLIRTPSAWSLSNIRDSSYDVVFTSHMVEHIPYQKINQTLAEINRIMKVGGVVRILCPDLKKLAQAYVNAPELMDKYTNEDPLAKKMGDLGSGGIFMNFLVSEGTDSFLFSRGGELIGGMAHVYAYDFQMLEALLKLNGFNEIREMKFCDSSIPELTEPLHPIGDEQIWKDEAHWIRPYGVTGFDRDPNHSLIIEAKKEKEYKKRKDNRLEKYQAARNINILILTLAWLNIVMIKILYIPVDFAMFGRRLFKTVRENKH